MPNRGIPSWIELRNSEVDRPRTVALPARGGAWSVPRASAPWQPAQCCANSLVPSTGEGAAGRFRPNRIRARASTAPAVSGFRPSSLAPYKKPRFRVPSLIRPFRVHLVSWRDRPISGRRVPVASSERRLSGAEDSRHVLVLAHMNSPFVLTEPGEIFIWFFLRGIWRRE